MGTVRFKVSFIHQVNAKLCGDFIGRGIVWIVRHAYGVEIVRLDHLKVAADLRDGKRFPVPRIVFVSIDAFDINRLFVDEKAVALYARVHNAYALGMYLEDIAVQVQKLDIEIVQIGCFRSPESPDGHPGG